MEGSSCPKKKGLETGLTFRRLFVQRQLYACAISFAGTFTQPLLGIRRWAVLGRKIAECKPRHTRASPAELTAHLFFAFLKYTARAHSSAVAWAL